MTADLAAAYLARAEAAEARVAVLEADRTWQPIETAPALERVVVAGLQPKSKGCAAYWWYHEDHTDNAGIPIEHPQAVMWISLAKLLPALPPKALP